MQRYKKISNYRSSTPFPFPLPLFFSLILRLLAILDSMHFPIARFITPYSFDDSEVA